jgi:predicted cobalt transporter CbtA
MFMRLFTSAIFAGALAGLVGGILQLGFVQPVLLMAELYETGQLVHFGALISPAIYGVWLFPFSSIVAMALCLWR